MPNNTITNTTTTTTTNTNNNSWSRSGDGTLTQQRPQPQPRKCFQCGRIGHETADCSSTITTQTKDGQEAFQEYLEQIEERRQSFAGTQKKRKERHKMYHCRKLQSWMQLQLQLQLQQIDKDEMDVTSNTKHCGSMQSYWYHGPYDPVLQVANIRRQKDTKNGTPACSGSGSSMSGGDATTSMEQIMNTTQRQPTTTTRTQEMHASYFEMAKHMHHSYREFFHSIMEPTRHQFNQDTTTTTPKKKQVEHDLIWQKALNDAVRVGAPADFSKYDSLLVYADNKLMPRSRYLYYLIMDDNVLSNKVRALLLPSVVARSSNNGDDDFIQVCSIGGGPGYDHLAICLATWFLYKIQPHPPYQQGQQLRSCKPKKIQTQIYDLYDQDWLPIVTSLQDSFCRVGAARATSVGVTQTKTVVSTTTAKSNGNSEEHDVDKNVDICMEDKDWWTRNQATMHYGDLRWKLQMGITSGVTNSNEKMGSCVRSADIIVFSFVLHENASFLVNEPQVQPTDGRARAASLKEESALRSILSHAKQGTIMICMDSGNTLWPPLKEAASKDGWVCFGDAEKDHKIFLGPKTFLILERTRIVS